MAKNNKFKGNNALITGASGDLERLIALKLSAEGAGLVLFDYPSTEPKLKQIASELGTENVIYICGDVSNVEDVKKLVQRCVEESGGIDILINGAVMVSAAPLELTEEAIFKRVQDVNVYGTFLMMKHVSSEMIKSGKRGVIINMSSVTGLTGIEITFALCASKFAVNGMTRAAAKSLAKYDIRVCAVAPFMIEGSITDKIAAEAAEITIAGGGGSGLQDQKAVEEVLKAGMLQMCPLSRGAKLSEVADTVLFLCSKEASYITGVVIPVDGGVTA